MKLKLDKTRVSFFALTVGLTTSAGICLSQIPASTDSVQRREASPPSTWVSVAWTGRNLPYHQVRIAIDNAYAQKKVTANTLDEYQSEYLRSHQPTLLFFKWAYASYIGSKQKPPVVQPSGFGTILLDQTPDPHCYDYTRLRFLFEASDGDKILIPLGKRLITKDPKDFAVTYAFINFYSPEEKGLTKQEAINYAQRMLCFYPKKIQIYSALGGIYYTDWLEKKSQITGKHSVSDGVKAVYYYQKYLQLTPKDDPFRKQAELLISDIQHPKF